MSYLHLSLMKEIKSNDDSITGKAVDFAGTVDFINSVFEGQLIEGSIGSFKDYAAKIIRKNIQHNMRINEQYLNRIRDGIYSDEKNAKQNYDTLYWWYKVIIDRVEKNVKVISNIKDCPADPLKEMKGGITFESLSPNSIKEYDILPFTSYYDNCTDRERTEKMTKLYDDFYKYFQNNREKVNLGWEKYIECYDKIYPDRNKYLYRKPQREDVDFTSLFKSIKSKKKRTSLKAQHK